MSDENKTGPSGQDGSTHNEKTAADTGAIHDHSTPSSGDYNASMIKSQPFFS